jgi:hypothetical protein
MVCKASSFAVLIWLVCAFFVIRKPWAIRTSLLSKLQGANAQLSFDSTFLHHLVWGATIPLLVASVVACVKGFMLRSNTR